MTAHLRWIAAGFDRKSALAITIALCTYSAIGWRWQHLINPRLGMDWLLAGIWVFMTLLLSWRIEARTDLRLILVGLCGGAFIEWWGTETALWWYFTKERPPVWIVPAWPVAALTIHRLPALIGRLWPGVERLGRVYLPLMLTFIVMMVLFMWPAVDKLPSPLVMGAPPACGRRRPSCGLGRSASAARARPDLRSALRPGWRARGGVEALRHPPP
jgi:hypothetical protein